MENKSYEYIFSFSQEEVQKFAEVTGDSNPIHLDSEYAKGTLFQRPIIHGLLGASVFSKIFGTLFPGHGTIYLQQDLRFLAPMYVNTSYLAEVFVKDQIKAKSRAVIETIIKNEEGKLVVSGEALIQNEIFK